MIIRGLTDSPLLPDPYSGLFWPQEITRAELTVQTDVPVMRTYDWVELSREPEIRVPADAWIGWNSAEERWITVGERYPEGLTTRARVTVEYPADFLERRWHDGTRFSSRTASATSPTRS